MCLLTCTFYLSSPGTKSIVTVFPLHKKNLDLLSKILLNWAMYHPLKHYTLNNLGGDTMVNNLKITAEGKI